MPTRITSTLACSRRREDDCDCLNPDQDRARPGDIERTDAVKAANSFYWEVFRCTRRRDWEVTLTSLFPSNSTWKTEARSESCGLPTDHYKDLKEDAYWQLPTSGASSSSKDVYLRAMQSLDADSALSSEFSHEQKRYSAPAGIPAATSTRTRPHPLRSNSNSALLPPVDTRKVQDINCMRASELHLEHSSDPRGCACEACMARAGVTELSPLEIIGPNGDVVENTWQRTETPELFTLTSTKPSPSIKSAATSVSDVSSRRSGISKFFHSISARSRSNTTGSSSLSFKLKRSDSGYETGDESVKA